MRTDNDLGKYASRTPQKWAWRAVVFSLVFACGYLIADQTFPLNEPLEVSDDQN